MHEFEEEGVESRTVADVKASTRFLLDSYKAKIADLKNAKSEVADFLRFGVDVAEASSDANSFFNTDTVRYIAIDGTDSIDERLDLVVFYVGAFAYGGEVKFTPNGIMLGDPKPGEESLSVSTAIPLSEEDAAQVFGQRREFGVEVDSERLPSTLMHFAEYYLAYRSIAGANPARIILLDRTLAGDVAHLVWSTRDLVRSRSCVLEGTETSAGRVTAFDLEVARMLQVNQALSIPAPRSQLLKFAAMIQLFGGGEFTARELIEKTGADPLWIHRLEDDLDEFNNQFGNFEKSKGSYKLRPGAEVYWDRVLAAVLHVADHVFHPRGGHPLRIRKGSKEAWITADDLEFMVLILIREITRRAWADDILPIGLIKDTSAFEFVNSAVPILSASGLVGTPSFPNFNSDKMLFQTNSVANCSEVPTPWHSVEIDAAFRTMAPVSDSTLPEGQARANGAYENVIYPERVYLKTYIQLWSSKTNPAVRSHVFTFDRPVYPEFDHWDELILRNKDGPVDEKISPVVHYKRGSPMTNLVMALLTEMGQEVVPEALGHNYPLFLADKKAKSILEGTRNAYRGAVLLEIARSGLDQEVLYSSQFREYRSQMEGKRKA